MQHWSEIEPSLVEKGGKYIGFLFTPLCGFYSELAFFLMLALVLTIADLRFGVERAKKEGVKVRWSYAIRRTMNKLADFIIWVTLAGLIGDGYGKLYNVPTLAYMVMAVIYSAELRSVWSNYRAVRGITTGDKTIIDKISDKFL